MKILAHSKALVLKGLLSELHLIDSVLSLHSIFYRVLALPIPQFRVVKRFYPCRFITVLVHRLNEMPLFVSWMRLGKT